MAKSNQSHSTDILHEKLDVLARLITVQLVHNDFGGLTQEDQIRVLSRHGLRNRDISSLLGVKPPNVSAALKK